MKKQKEIFCKIQNSLLKNKNLMCNLIFKWYKKHELTTTRTISCNNYTVFHKKKEKSKENNEQKIIQNKFLTSFYLFNLPLNQKKTSNLQPFLHTPSVNVPAKHTSMIFKPFFRSGMDVNVFHLQHHRLRYVLSLLSPVIVISLLLSLLLCCSIISES